jgi:hypothetical protein
MAKTAGVPVTLRALLQRINRKLGKEDERLVTARGEKARVELGDYYILNVNRNWLVSQHVDPETLGRELGVLRAWEAVKH